MLKCYNPPGKSMKFRNSFIAILTLAIAAGCSQNNSGAGAATTGGPSANVGGEKPLVVFAQANSKDPWRQVFDAETKAAADTHASDFSFEEQQADDDVNKQADAIGTMLVKNPKVLLVSPVADGAQQAIADAKDKGVYVILLDRSVPGDKWDVYVGGDNHAIGVQAGDEMGKLLNGKGTVLMIRGIADATPTKDRGDGFMEAIKKFPGITVIQGDDCGYQREKAQTYMENFLSSKKPFDAVYAHNDEMAIGAVLAMQAAKTPKKVVIGIDGCQKETMQYIKDGKIDATFAYPDPGPKGIELADDVIKGKPPTDKKVLLPTTMITKDNVDDYMKQHPNLAG